ncbi:hypothetical protein D1AOALGA4SA_8490 [Olavius algarvensis Delta 1 endosymbiont]|nr:hypothetical protein D1AOALGA4SA_8490 [Olavius algarvensis Delta 1 endosymbiont]
MKEFYPFQFPPSAFRLLTFLNLIPNSGKSVPSIEHPASSIQHRVSSIEYPVSSIP